MKFKCPDIIITTILRQDIAYNTTDKPLDLLFFVPAHFFSSPLHPSSPVSFSSLISHLSSPANFSSWSLHLSSVVHFPLLHCSSKFSARYTFLSYTISIPKILVPFSMLVMITSFSWLASIVSIVLMHIKLVHQ